MSFETWLAFVAASLILTLTPGPSILLGVVHSLHFGLRKTLFTALGDISANALQMLLVAFGLGVIIAQSAVAFMVIKWFGVATLAYMALKMLLSRGSNVELEQVASVSSRRKLFRDGFLVAAGNPKALVFFTAFFPQFIDPSQPLWTQMAIMVPTMALLDFTIVMLYAAGARHFLGFIRSRPTLLNKAGGTALLGASAFLASAR